MLGRKRSNVTRHLQSRKDPPPKRKKNNSETTSKQNPKVKGKLGETEARGWVARNQTQFAKGTAACSLKRTVPKEDENKATRGYKARGPTLYF